MAITMQAVKELRDRTQAGLNDCKNALNEAAGDMEAAVEIILKKGLAKSAKRAGAVAAEGVVAARVADDGRSGVIVEVNIQTDFAARNKDYLAFVDKVVAVAEKADEGADLLGLPDPDGEGTMEDVRQRLIARLGENIQVRRWGKLSVPKGRVHGYVHMGGSHGALVAIEADDATSSKDEFKAFAEGVAMHIVAAGPRYLEPSDIDPTDKAKQTEIFDAQLAEEGKPEGVRPRIIEGKLNKWQKEVCLLEQQSVVDTEKTVRQLQQATGDEIGGLKIVGFVRYERGEGVEKKEDNFAEEAQKMAKG
jgi:elongation factor Ts